VVGTHSVTLDALDLFGVGCGHVARGRRWLGLGLGRLQIGTQLGDERLSLRQQLRRASVFATGHTFNQRADVVAAGQQQHHQLVGQFQLAATHLVEHAFHHVGKGHHMVQAEQAAGALDGVRCAKNRVDHFGFFVGTLYRQQGGFHVFEEFTTFNYERLQCVIQIQSHVSSLRLQVWRASPSPDGRQNSPPR